MEIGNYVSEQLLLFCRAIGLGVCLGLLYDVLRALRRLGGKLWCGVLDAGYCLAAAAAVMFFVLAGDGELRFFVAIGVLGGAVLFWCLLGPALRPVWIFWVELALLPVRLVRSFLKKWEKRTKKGFSFCRNWVTIKATTFRQRKSPLRQEGAEAMVRPDGSKKKTVPQKKKKKAVRSGSRLTVLILAALLVGIGLQICRMFGQIRTAQAEEAVYAQQLEELRETNRQLQEDLDNSGSQALIEDIARDKLGMVWPDEKVFHLSQ